MGIAITLQHYLDAQGITYEELQHRRTSCSKWTAEASHVSGSDLAKAVVLRRRQGYIVAVLPASRQVDLEVIGGWLKQPVGLASEEEVANLFPDCEPGAVPPIAAAYGLRSIVDDSLEQRSDIYFEAGDHRTLVHVSGSQFGALVCKVPHGRFCAPTFEDRDPHYSGA